MTKSTEEVCRIFGISKSTLFRWEQEGRIPPPKRTGRMKERMYASAQLEALLMLCFRPVFNQAFAGEDCAVIANAFESLFLTKVLIGKTVGVDEIRAFAKQRPLAPSTMKGLLAAAATQFSAESWEFKALVGAVHASCA